VGLAARGVQANLRASAEGEAEGRSHHRARTELDGRGHLLEAVNHAGQLVPLALLRGQQQLHQVGADAEVFAVAGDDEAGKVAHRVGGGVEHRGDHREHVAADGVLERVQLDAADAVAEIDERRAGVGADHGTVRAAEIGNARVAGAEMGMALELAGRRGWKHCAAVGRVPGGRSGGEQAFNARADGQPRAFMRATVEATPAASHISKGPSSQLKPARMA
jgi:hypothetical protein